MDRNAICEWTRNWFATRKGASRDDFDLADMLRDFYAEKAAWTPITLGNPAPLYSVVIGPKKPDFPHIPPWRSKIIFTGSAVAQLAQGWTHFCPRKLPAGPIAAPPVGESMGVKK